MTADAYTVVIPTVGRPSLPDLLRSLDQSPGPTPAEVIVVDDRRRPQSPLALPPTGLPTRVQRGRGAGPAAARNVGWRTSATAWVVFLDDDVVVDEGWREALAADLAVIPDDAAASQARLSVPQPRGRRPTDWERNVAGLETACWITADMAYRRAVLEEVGGFDERFPRAFREDADIGLRVNAAGYLLLQGERRSTHPVRHASPWVSIRAQAGNADDVLMRALHGPDWRLRAHAEGGRTDRHVATTMAAAIALASSRAHRRRLAAVAALMWAAGTAELAARRIVPGPRTVREVTTMLATSTVLPPAATAYWAIGWGRLPKLLSDASRAPLGQSRPPLAVPWPTVRGRWRYGLVPRQLTADVEWRPQAILLDRDGTLVVDVPYNGEPDAVVPMPGVRQALRRARAAGLAVGAVTNQSGVGRGQLTLPEVDAVNRRVEELVGRIDVWAVCPHAPDDGCGCRKPAPGLIKEAANRLGVDPSGCAVIGDTAADVDAAAAAGARGVLVPTRATRSDEIRAARQVAPDLLTAIDLVVGGRC